MAQKNATPTKEQKVVLQRHNLQDYLWTVMKDFEHSLMIRHRITGEVRVLDKTATGNSASTSQRECK